MDDITSRYTNTVPIEEYEDWLEDTYISPPTSPVKPTAHSYILALLNQGAPASRLPHDILTRIFRFHFADFPDEDKASRSELKTRRSVALVCRSWRPSAQRLIFKEIHIRKINNLVAFVDMITRSKTGVGAYVGPYVETLHLSLVKNSAENERLADKDVPGQVDRLFRMLPNLTVLRLRLGKEFAKADFSKLHSFRELRSITLDTALYDKDLLAYRHILRATPNSIPHPLKRPLRSAHRDSEEDTSLRSL